MHVVRSGMRRGTRAGAQMGGGAQEVPRSRPGKAWPLRHLVTDFYCNRIYALLSLLVLEVT